MKRIYFVTEGPTDQIVLQALVEQWLGGEEFVPVPVQPPPSAIVEDPETRLSAGWKGVLAWCAGARPAGRAGRSEALHLAHCLFVHLDADVAGEPDVKDPPFSGPCPPAHPACDWVRAAIIDRFGGALPPNAVLCVPAQDLEAWVLCCLHPDVADEFMPIECRAEPGALLVQRKPYRLVRRKDGALQKQTGRYREHAGEIAAGWPACAGGEPPRCPEAARFEREARARLRA